MMASLCKDCLSDWRISIGATEPVLPTSPMPVWTKRKLTHPGPRCTTHGRLFAHQQKARRHEGHVGRTYGLAPGEYEKLLQAQQGRCAVCQRARGVTAKLVVDHDHVTGLVRGLLCQNCNRWVVTLGRGGLARAVRYLYAPPALGALGQRTVPSYERVRWSHD